MVTVDVVQTAILLVTAVKMFFVLQVLQQAMAAQCLHVHVANHVQYCMQMQSQEHVKILASTNVALMRRVLDIVMSLQDLVVGTVHAICPAIRGMTVVLMQ